MSETETDNILTQIDERLFALSAAAKVLKKPSTISFAERQSLATKATKAAAELRARREEAEGTVEPSEAVTVALAEADRVLGLVDAAQPGGASKHGASGAANVGGQGRRSSGGMNSQQRPPDRIGS
jgi:hypothetical protein